jgi:hypothetical protein
VASNLHVSVGDVDHPWHIENLLCFVCLEVLTPSETCADQTLHSTTWSPNILRLYVCLLLPADKLMGHAIETIMMAVNSGAAPASRSLGVKFLFIAWAIFSVIMLSAYTGELTSSQAFNYMFDTG